MESNKITVRIDHDDVLNNFTEHFVQRHYENTGEKLSPSGWDFHEDSAYGEEIYDLLAERDFFITAEIEEDADKLFMFLENNSSVFDYQIVSSYYGSSEKEFEHTYRQKINFYNKHLTNSKDVIDRFTLVNGGKEDYPADIIIDDHMDNLKGKNDTGKNLKILYHSPHNKSLRNENDDPTIITNIGSMMNLISLLRDVMVQGNVENYLKNKLFVDI